MPRTTPNKWGVLVLATLGHMLVVGLPWTVMPVLFTAASQELRLSLSQIGLLWSMLPVGAAIVALPGGMLGDRLGYVKTIGIGCFAVAFANGLRGVSNGLPTLTISMFLCGAAVALVFPNLQRLPGVVFPLRQVGVATGIMISGFAIGGALTTALSATVIMPLLGSWRYVLFLYSGFCVVTGTIWLIVMRGHDSRPDPGPIQATTARPSFQKSVATVFAVKDAWLLALGNLGVVGAFIALNGYLPVYLEKIGLARSVADTMSSLLFVASIFGAISVPAIADRVGGAKRVLIACAVITAVTIALLAVVRPALFWVLIPLAGAITQGVGTLTIARAVQINEIGLGSAGTVLGLIGGMSNFGGFVMPLIGGSLAERDQAWPFLLWAAASLAAALCFAALRASRSNDR